MTFFIFCFLIIAGILSYFWNLSATGTATGFARAATTARAAVEAGGFALNLIDVLQNKPKAAAPAYAGPATRKVKPLRGKAVQRVRDMFDDEEDDFRDYHGYSDEY